LTQSLTINKGTVQTPMSVQPQQIINQPQNLSQTQPITSITPALNPQQHQGIVGIPE
jgi:hypothetical protein